MTYNGSQNEPVVPVVCCMQCRSIAVVYSV